MYPRCRVLGEGEEGGWEKKEERGAGERGDWTERDSSRRRRTGLGEIAGNGKKGKGLGEIPALCHALNFSLHQITLEDLNALSVNAFILKGPFAPLSLFPLPLFTVSYELHSLGGNASSFDATQAPDVCRSIIEQFQKCHLDHPIGKFFGKCTDLKIKLDHCFRQEKALKRKANFEESKKLKERLQAHRKEIMREDLK
ncbi:unnamed protein product [Camellia sinensis]